MPTIFPACRRPRSGQRAPVGSNQPGTRYKICAIVMIATLAFPMILVVRSPQAEAAAKRTDAVAPFVAPPEPFIMHPSRGRVSF